MVASKPKQSGQSTEEADVVVLRQHRAVVVAGAGPAGLTAAYEVVRRAPENRPLVLEASGQLGGIARTEQHRGYRFDIGGHRFFTKVGEVEALWEEILGDQMIDVPRSSRIYYRGKYYDYPLRLMNALENLGLFESVRVVASYLKWQIRPSKVEENFQQWVSNRFGGRLFRHFFESYTEKVWGISCKEIRADWAAQRIKNLSLSKAVLDALTGRNDTSSLIKTFRYPRLGPGQMWERAAELVVQKGGEVRLNARVASVEHDGSRVTGVRVEPAEGPSYLVQADQLISSMAITDLIGAMKDVPAAVTAAAAKLRYRDFLIVTLILDHSDPFPDNWIYIHSPDVRVGRIQNFRAWSAAMVPDPDHASIGMEYFCQAGDGLWATGDADLIELAAGELEKLELAPRSSVLDGAVIRQPRAYPVYDADYKPNLEIVRQWLAGFENLQSVGRNGMHRYNNQDHSMLAGMLAARNVLGERHDIWNVNLERSYHEDFTVAERAA